MLFEKGGAMGRLSKRDKEFLQQNGISLELVFDASGMPTRVWKQRMREEGKLFAFGVQCLRGHSLKARSGNCIRCNTANIAYQMRSNRAGYIYIARSKSLGLTKVGFSADDPDNRIYIANLESYAGASDWDIVMRVNSAEAGRLELDLHSELREYRLPLCWIRNGEECEAREVYECGAQEAIDAVTAVLRKRRLSAR